MFRDGLRVVVRLCTSFVCIASLPSACGGKTESSGAAGDGFATGGASGVAVTHTGGALGTGLSHGGTATAGVSNTAGVPMGGFATASGGYRPASGGESSSSGGFPGAGGMRDAGAPFEAGVDSAPVSTPCSFTFMVTTVSYNGRFSPQNVAAIWIEDGTGAFVKTLNKWGQIFMVSAIQFNSATGGNSVDAITAATRTNDGAVTGKWNCTDVSGTRVPSGPYVACIEFEEDPNLPGLGIPTHYTCQPFVLGDGATSGTWPDETNFVSMSWTFVPYVSAGLSDL
jgi:hypothetical protein